MLLPSEFSFIIIIINIGCSKASRIRVLALCLAFSHTKLPRSLPSRSVPCVRDRRHVAASKPGAFFLSLGRDQTTSRRCVDALSLTRVYGYDYDYYYSSQVPGHTVAANKAGVCCNIVLLLIVEDSCSYPIPSLLHSTLLVYKAKALHHHHPRPYILLCTITPLLQLIRQLTIVGPLSSALVLSLLSIRAVFLAATSCFAPFVHSLHQLRLPLRIPRQSRLPKQ